MLRLVWRDGEPAGALRAAPPGRYRLSGYRVISGRFMLSGSGGRDWHDLKAGVTARLPVADRPRLRVSINANNGKLRVGASFQGAQKMGVTLYRDGRRVELPFTVTRYGGAAPTKGVLRYG